MVLVTKNFTRSKKEVRLDLDTIKLCEAAGFLHEQGDDTAYPARHRRHIKNPSFWIINYWKKHPDAPRIEYEDVLVFRKPLTHTHTHQGIGAIVTSPPYGITNNQSREKITPTAQKNGRELIGKVYSSNPNNIGNLRYQ